MSESAQTHPHQDFNDLPVGEILKRTREHYGRTIEEVERSLRIRAEQIHAIEVGDTEALPARVYAIGFVRSYAEYLGLDGEKIVALFKAQSDQDKNIAPDLQFPTPTDENKAPPVWIVVASLALIAAILIGVVGGSDKEVKIEDTVPEVPVALKAESIKEEQQAALEESLAPKEEEIIPEPVAEKPKGIILKMVNNSWVEIRDQNKRKLISRVLKAGDQYFVPDRDGLTISIGNAGGVEIFVDGDALENIGVKGQVIRNIPLNADALKTRFGKSE